MRAHMFDHDRKIVYQIGRPLVSKNCGGFRLSPDQFRNIGFKFGDLGDIDRCVGVGGLLEAGHQRLALVLERGLPRRPAFPNHTLVHIQPIDSAFLKELRVVRCVLAETQYRIGKILRRADFGQRLIELVLDDVERLFLVGQDQKALPAKNEVESDGGDRVRFACPRRAFGRQGDRVKKFVTKG